MTIEEIFETTTRLFSRLVRWLQQTRRWLFWDARVGWLVAAVLVLFALSLLFPLFCLERQVRLSSIVLQLVGFGTVAWGLHTARMQFSKPTLWQSFKMWLQQRPGFHSQSRVLSAKAGMYSISGGSVRMARWPGPDTPLARRVEILEENLKRLTDEVGSVSGALGQKVDELSRALETERGEREAGDKRNEKQLDEAVVGGLHLEVAGIIFFGLGTITGAVSSELASLWEAQLLACSVIRSRCGA